MNALIQVERTPGTEAAALIRSLPELGLVPRQCRQSDLREILSSDGEIALVAGDMVAMHAAFDVLSLNAAPLDPYPNVLGPHLRRDVWKSRVGLVRQDVEEMSRPLFVRPRGGDKLFTGFVYESKADEWRWRGAEFADPVWAGGVRGFTNEHRAYILRGEVLAVCPYGVGPHESPPQELLRDMVDAMADVEPCPDGFAIDIGVLDDDRWALVECNDGFALGLYPGLGERDYARLILARWEQLTASKE